jgi:MFS family permease
VLGGLLIQRAMRDSGDFHTSAAPAVGTVVGAAVLVFVAFRVGRRSTGPAAKPAPRPLVVGIGAFVKSSVFFAMAEGWPGFVASVLLLAVAAVVVARLSRRPGWQARHRLALASGALFTYAWGGFVLTWLKYRMDPVSLVGNAVFALGAVVLVVAAWRRSTRDRGDLSGPESTITESDGGRTGAGRQPR